jgi:hypothetical protein
MEKELIVGEVVHHILENSKMEKEMGMEYGNQQITIMIFIKGNISMIRKMDMEFINGLTVLFIKDSLNKI